MQRHFYINPLLPRRSALAFLSIVVVMAVDEIPSKKNKQLKKYFRRAGSPDNGPAAWPCHRPGRPAHQRRLYRIQTGFTDYTWWERF